CASLADIFEDWQGQMTSPQGLTLWCRRDGAPTPLRTAGDRPFTLNDARLRLWGVIRKTPHLNYQLLTKRPENIARMMPHGEWPNVWLGTTVENQENLIRADMLLETPQKVPVRFISYEPAIGPLNASSVQI